MWSVLAGGTLLVTLIPAATAEPSSAPPTGGTAETVVSRAFETTPDGKPLVPTGGRFYEAKATDFGVAQPGQVGATKAALPLPDVPSGWDVGHENECRSPANAGNVYSLEGWTQNHYRWCRGATVHWQRLKCGTSGCRLTDEILIEVMWLGYADARNRKFHIWGKTFDTVETIGEFEDDALVAAWADCAGEPGKSACSKRYQPDRRSTLEDIKEERNNVFESVLTDTSIADIGLTGDAIAPLQIYSWFTGRGGAGHAASILDSVGNRVASRCDSAQLRSKKACIFNNVRPFLTYDKNDTAYPVASLIDHIRYAQDQLRAPGRWRNAGPDGPPLTRTRNSDLQDENRKQPKAQCRTARPGGWNWRVEQCDEYPFASVKEGGASGGPVSGRLIPAAQNREGGIQLNNWYEWDRIIQEDTFWVNLIG
ncbi:hypothetical protein GCM10022243_00280 [Saccharothrix violaceirubra]